MKVDINDENAVLEFLREQYTDEIWSDMSDFEIFRHKKMYISYRKMVDIGLAPLVIPDFMSQREEEEEESPPDPDEHLFKKPAAPPISKANRRTRSSSDNNDSEYRSRVKVAKGVEEKRDCKENNDEVNEEPKDVDGGCRYPKRSSLQRVDYFERAEPTEDEYVYCDKCKIAVPDFCRRCGLLIMLRDTKVKKGVPDRAMKTLPSAFLEIKPSPIHGYGVFAKRDLLKRLKVGPYEGLKTRVESTEGYAWKLRNGYLIDAQDTKNSNWLRYVNCARHHEEQNLVAFQYKGELYYRASRNIKAGEELLVYYGKTFAEQLGIDTDGYFKSKTNDIKDTEEYFSSKTNTIEDRVDTETYLTPNTEVIEDGIYFCKHCNMGICDKAFFEKHEPRCPDRKKIVPKVLYKCQYCHVSVADKDFLSRHEIYCGERKKMLKMRKINDRIEVDIDEDKGNKENVYNKKEWSCYKCDKEYRSKEGLDKHLSVIHNVGDKMYTCDLCKYSTKRQDNMSQHKRMHTSEYVFICNICGKGYHQKVQLVLHVASKHNTSQDNIHKCHLCTYYTVRKGDLKQHINDMHTRDTIRKCTQCSYTSTQKGHLNSHIRSIHTSTYRYKCTTCNKGFNQKPQLIAHQYTHNDKPKPYPCTQCTYASAHKCSLTRHIRKIHSKTRT